MLGLMLAGGALGLVGPSEQGDPPPPETMRRYVIGFLYRAPNPPPIGEAEADEIQRQHLAYMSALYKRGILILAGPFLDRTDLRGICLYSVETVEEAQALGEQDPAVRAGRLRFEYHPWYGAKGITIVPPEPERK
jgi:uncharacterized protein YciI